jgi:putative transposase
MILHVIIAMVAG